MAIRILVLHEGECSTSIPGKFIADSVQNGHYTEGWVGPTDGLDALKKGKLFPAGDRKTFLRRPTCSLVTTLTTFPRQLRKTKCFQRIHYKYFIFNTFLF
jgi:hypothetical protein